MQWLQLHNVSFAELSIIGGVINFLAFPLLMISLSITLWCITLSSLWCITLCSLWCITLWCVFFFVITVWSRYTI